MNIDKTTYKEKKIQIRMNADHTSRPDVFYFLLGVYSDAIGTHFLKQLPTHNGTFAFATTQPDLKKVK